MVRQQELHAAQLSILDTLRHAPAASFSTLMQPTGMTSDVFKFHVRSLLNDGYISKQTDGYYRLTNRGKEYANNLDTSRSGLQKQPKLSVLVFASRTNANGKTEYVFQKRLRKPYYGYWSVIGGPVQWGEPAETTAARELHKQTGLAAATFKICSFYRKRDYVISDRSLLEDKLFILLKAHDLSGELANSWRSGQNQWLTVAAFRKQSLIFKETLRMITMLEQGETYHTSQAFYDTEQY